tara:strand:+ start:677 stop:1312 length:636 start_codon:yes stop_codon:yes gene_type:complete
MSFNPMKWYKSVAGKLKKPTRRILTSNRNQDKIKTTNMPKKTSKISDKKPVRELQTKVEIKRSFVVQKKLHMKQKTLDVLALACKRELPRNNGVTQQDFANGELLQRQFQESAIRVVNLTHRTIMTFDKSKILNILAFLKINASFYDVELLLTDPPRFFKRLSLWMANLRQSKKKSNVDIGKTMELDCLYTRTVSNESNMFKGRNTTADVL